MSDIGDQDLHRELVRLREALRQAETENQRLRQELAQRVHETPDRGTSGPGIVPAPPPSSPVPPLRPAPSGMLEETVKDMGQMTGEQLDSEIARQLAARRREVLQARRQEQAASIEPPQTQPRVVSPDPDAEDDVLSEQPTRIHRPDDPDAEDYSGTNVVSVDEILAEAGRRPDEDS